MSTAHRLHGILLLHIDRGRVFFSKWRRLIGLSMRQGCGKHRALGPVSQGNLPSDQVLPSHHLPGCVGAEPGLWGEGL